MIISEQWVREWAPTKLDTQALADALTMGGFEVEGIERAGPELNKVVVGEIISIENHPHADRLKLCQVDVGRNRKLKIVCGAPNARTGLKAPVALTGARLPNGLLVAKTRIRQILSNGMLCSAAELNLHDDASGLMELNADANLGLPIGEYLKLDDNLLEIGLTPNRGDCLSIAGMAREVSALTACPLNKPALRRVRAQTNKKLRIRLKAPNECSRYVGRVIENVDVNAPTPDWMLERLRKCGIRGVSIVVDITNYVMTELGSPMHAFDLDKLHGGITVRLATAGERLTLLDGKKLKLDAETLVIADDESAVALAGIMGGADSAIGDKTKNIFLECAFFNPETIAGKGRIYGLQTDAIYHFERGVDFALQHVAIERATEFVLKYAGAKSGAKPGPIVDAANKRYLPKRQTISLRQARVPKILGAEIKSNQISDALKRLNMRVSGNLKGWRVTPPSYRFDISGEHDLIEEVARVTGYEKIPSRAPLARRDSTGRREAHLTLSRLMQLLVDRDYQEVITYSFVDENLLQNLNPKHKPVPLVNPIADNMSVMRTSLLAGLLQAVAHNYKRQFRRIRLCESGHAFFTAKGVRTEKVFLSGVITGDVHNSQWGVQDREIDFFDLKGDVEAVLELTGQTAEFSFEPIIHPALQAGQAAAVSRKNKKIGLLGRLAPQIQADLDIDQPVFVFELEAAALEQGSVPEYTEISRFPGIRRDLNVVVDESVSADDILGQTAKIAGRSLKNLELFDVYRGEHIDFGKKSVSFRLTLQDSSRTLTDDDAERIKNRVLNSLNQRLGAVLRA